MAGQPRRAFIALLALVLAYTMLATTSPAESATSSHPAQRCKRPAHGFVPTKAGIPAIGRTVKVIQVKRTSSGAIGAGPVSQSGKWLMAMDPKRHPGGHRGTVILSGHTWPDGSALGNAMLEHLWTGNGIILAGAHDTACYRINRRKSYPANQVPSKYIFRPEGPEQVVIVACSGKRLGPGNWTRRTVWFATPWIPKPPPKPTPPSSPPPPNNCLLCGLLGGH